MSVSRHVTPNERRTTWLLAGVACLGLVVHALVFRAVFQGHCPDDAYISFRFADNLAHGHGLVFNPGERVEGYSNFLWVLVLAIGARFTTDLTGTAQALGVLASCLAVIVAMWSARRVFDVRGVGAQVFALAFLAGSGYLAAWSVGGLETGLFTLSLLAAWFRYSIEIESATPRRPLSALCFGAVALCRPEGVWIAVAMCVLHVVLSRRAGHGARRTWAFPLVLLGIVAAYETFRFATYGASLLPNSVRAKVGFSWSEVERGAVYVARYFVNPYAVLLLCSLFARRLWRRPAYVVGQLLFLGYVLFVLAAGGDWSRGRFFAPALPLGVVLLLASWQEHAASGGWLARKRGVAAAAAVAYAMLCFVVTSPFGEMRLWRAWAPGDAERIAIGHWLRQAAPADATVGVLAAGQIPYYSRLRAHDMLGLNDAHIASVEVADMGRGTVGHEKFDAQYTLVTVRPDILVGAARLAHFKRHPAFAQQYRRVQSFWHLHEVYIRQDVLPRMRQ